MSAFEALLKEISEATGIELAPDAKDTCLIKYRTGVSVQMEIDRRGEYFRIGAELGSVPLGRYREDLFEAALKANGAPYPRNGTLAYSTRAEQMVLCHELALNGLRGHQVAEALTPFVEKALRWKEAIARGHIPPPEGAELPPGARMRETPFGLRP